MKKHAALAALLNCHLNVHRANASECEKERSDARCCWALLR